MTPAGQIRIELHHHQGAVTDVRIVSSRPTQLTRVLQGQTPENMLNRVPLLFTLCGNAQAYAALSACRAALALPDTVASDAARQQLVLLETLREQAWRVLLEWPRWLGAQADKTALAGLLRFDALLKNRLFKDGAAFALDSQPLPAANIEPLLAELSATVDAAVFNGDLQEFLKLENEADLRGWLAQNRSLSARLLADCYRRDWQGLGGNSVACLPPLTPERVNEEILKDPDGFCQQPLWRGRCHESSALGRRIEQPLMADLHSRHGNGLIIRYAARLSEIAGLPEQMRQLAERLNDSSPLTPDAPLGNGAGLAQVQAARGLLIHRLELRQGRVYDYRIVAPTEWNFHPNGVVAAGLKRLDGAPAKLKQQADLWITAIDPCVQYELLLTEVG